MPCEQAGAFARPLPPVDKHWDGIAAYCEAENKIALGFVEGLNNKIRLIQRRAYGLRDEEYLRLKVSRACGRSSETVEITHSKTR